jgi:hypothetical protein
MLSKEVINCKKESAAVSKPKPVIIKSKVPIPSLEMVEVS